MKIPLTSIAVINRQRKSIDMDKLADLAASIEANTLLHPIVVRRPFDTELEAAGGRPFVLCVGGRRLAAHAFLGRTEIAATLLETLDPISARICELDENIKRADVTWQEQVDARAEIAALVRKLNPDAVHSEVADAAGVSEAQLTKDLQLSVALTADPTLRTAASKGSAIRTAAYKTEIDRRISAVKGIDLADLRTKLHTADGRTFIRQVPSKSIDLVFCDLPYGFDYFAVVDSDGIHGRSGESKYDDSIQASMDFATDLIPEMLRVVKSSGWIVLFMGYELHGWLQEQIHDVCMTSFTYVDPTTRYCLNCTSASASPCPTRRPEMPPWIWTRRGKGNNGHWPELHASNRYEMLVVTNAGSAKLAKKPVENVLDFAPVEGERLHTMQKPMALCQEIIERCTVPGETVLDVCFGSGAHLAAAASLGREFLGCDSNPANLSTALALVAQFSQKSTSRLSLIKESAK